MNPPGLAARLQLAVAFQCHETVVSDKQNGRKEQEQVLSDTELLVDNKVPPDVTLRRKVQFEF